MTSSVSSTSEATREVITASQGDAQPFFNLIDEPWIPVLYADGTAGEVSITEVFAQAAEIRELHGELPTMRPAILRVLIAIMTRALGFPRSPDDWGEKIAGWSVVALTARQYLESHRDRFWLSHPTEPFFQAADLGPASGDTKHLGTIVADFPANVQFFTQRGPDSLERMAPAEAARWLIHTQAYDTSGIKTPDRRDTRAKGGKVYPLGTAWAGKGELLIASGSNLADTLRFNFLSPSAVDVVSGDDDLPPWERPHPGPTEEFDAPATPAGFIQVYTWQARRIRLVFDNDAVTKVVLTYGDPLAEQNRNNFDPMMTWRYSKPQSKTAGHTVFMPGMVDPSKDVWRGLAAWLPTKAQQIVEGNPKNLEPAVLRWIGVLHRNDLLPRSMRPDITLFGVEYGPQNATFTDVVADSLTVPPFLLSEESVDVSITVIAAIDEADTAAWYLGTFAANLARARGIESADTYRAEAKETAYVRFGELFARWLSTLAVEEDSINARRRWQKLIRDETTALADQLTDESGPLTYLGRIVDPDNATWLNTEIALGYLNRGIKKTLPLAYEKETHDTDE